MPVLICSPDRRANRDLIFDRILSGAREGRRQLLIVPETHSHRAEKELLHRGGNPIGAMASVTTFTRLADRALEEQNVRIQPIDGGGRVLMMYRAVRSVEPMLTYYRNIALRSDILTGLIEAVSELRSCCISPEQLAANIPGLTPKLRDLSLIYTAYCAVCGDRPAHGADRLEAALDAVEKSSRTVGADLLLYGFDGFTAAEYHMLERLHRVCAGVTVALEIGGDSQLFAEQIKTKGRLERLLGRLDVVAPDPAEQTDPLRRMGRVLFDFTCEKLDAEGKVKLYECRDVHEECELAAGLCRSLTAEDGARLRDIAIVTSEADKYETYLCEAFARYGLPLYLSRREQLLEKAPAAAALGAYRAIEDGLSFASVLRYMKSGLTGLTRDEQELLENYAYTWQIHGSQWLNEWTMPPDGYDAPIDSAVMEELNELRERLVAPIRALRSSLPAAAGTGTFLEALKTHWQALALESQLEVKAQSLEDSGRRQEAAEYRQIMEIITRAGEQFAAVMGEEELARGEFLSLFELMLGQYTVGTIPVSLDVVEFSDFRRVAFDRIDHLIILGAREGAMPPAVTGTGLLRESDRIMLETMGIELTQSDEERIFEYMSNISLTADSAVKSITFTYPKRSVDGNDSVRSYLLNRVRDLMDVPIVPAEETIRRNALLAPVPSFERMCIGQGKEAAAALRHYAGLEQGARLTTLSRYDRAGRGPIRSRDAVTGLYGETLYMSATRADAINGCRFQYFMRYGLKAAERRIAEFRAANVGTLVHFVVEKGVRELFTNPDRVPEDVVRELMEEFLNTRLGGEEGKSARFMANYRRIEGNAVEIVRDVMEEIGRSAFKPIAYEMDFGIHEDSMPPYRVEGAAMPMEVHGSIDRVDARLAGNQLQVRVSDYKTGTKTFSLSDVLDGFNMQMFIYLLMLESAPRDRLRALAQETLGGAPEEIVPCAALYIPVKSPYVDASGGEDVAALRQKAVRRFGLVRDDKAIVEALERREGDEFRFLPVKYLKNGSFSASSNVADERGIELLLDKTRRNLREIADAVADGDIETTPYEEGSGSSCDWCPYREACQFDTTMNKDRYRYLRSFKDDQVLERLEEEASANAVHE